MRRYILILSSAFFFACSNNPEGDIFVVTQSDLDLVAKAQNYFKPLPASADIESPKAQLGKKLFFETALSASGELSCNSCHILDQFGVDNLPNSVGYDGIAGERNSLSVYNTAFHTSQFWDGRAANLSEQARMHILHPAGMGMTDEATLVNNLKAIENYVPLFAAAYPDVQDPINLENIAEAIAEFEKCLNTPARFDQYLEGTVKSLTEEERIGLEAFINVGCATCHLGPGLGGNMFQMFGLVKGPYWKYTGSEIQDEGRGAVTKNDFEKYFFKVPSLRNVEKTAPYFHDGSVESMEESVKIMAVTQLGKDLSEEEVASIVVFMKCLTGEIPPQAMATE